MECPYKSHGKRANGQKVVQRRCLHPVASGMYMLLKYGINVHTRPAVGGRRQAARLAGGGLVAAVVHPARWCVKPFAEAAMEATETSQTRV